MSIFRIYSRLISVGLMALCLSLASHSYGAAKKTSKEIANTTQIKLIEDSFSKYNSTPLVNIKVLKTIKNPFSTKEKKESGEMSISGGKMRWQTSTPDKSLIIFDGQFLWSEQAAVDSKAKVIVTKAQIDKGSSGNAFIRILTGKAKLIKSYKIVQVNEKAGVLSYKLSAKDSKSPIKTVKIKINKNTMEILELIYQDEIENETKLVFEKIEFINSAQPELFVYKPKSGIKVNEL